MKRCHPLPRRLKDLGESSGQLEDLLVRKRDEVDWEAGPAEGKGGIEGEEDDTNLEPLTEKQLNQVFLAEEVFGMHIVSLALSVCYDIDDLLPCVVKILMTLSFSQLQQLFAKPYAVRERGLGAVLQVVETKEAGLSRKETSTLVKATCQVLVKGLHDKVFSVKILQISVRIMIL